MSKIDFGFSEDGDLVLGGAKTDSTGALLYIYSDGTISTEPLRNGIEGKLIRELSYTYDRKAYKQIILNRLKTDAPDWFHYPSMGGNLTDLIGEPNTRETGALGVELITTALTYGGLFTRQELNVRAVPISEQEIMFVIQVVTAQDEPYRLPLVFNLNHGLREV